MKLISNRHPDNNVELEQELPEGLYLQLKAICRSCLSSYDFDGDIDDFDESMSFCGKSPMCLP